MNPTVDLFIRRFSLLTAGIIVCVVAGSAVVARVPSLRTRVLPSTVPQGYQVGELLDVAPAVYNNYDFSVVVFADVNCPACQAAVPFLERFVLLASRTSAGGAAVLMTTSLDEPADSMILRMRKSGATVLTPSRWKVTKMRLQAVPTMMIVDRKGRVRFVHAGVPENSDEEARLLDAAWASFGARRGSHD
jgi:hypothetical protein